MKQVPLVFPPISSLPVWNLPPLAPAKQEVSHWMVLACSTVPLGGLHQICTLDIRRVRPKTVLTST